MTGIDPTLANKNLEFNYRLPKKIARAAIHIQPQDESYINSCRREGDQLHDSQI